MSLKKWHRQAVKIGALRCKFGEENGDENGDENGEDSVKESAA